MVMIQARSGAVRRWRDGNADSPDSRIPSSLLLRSSLGLGRLLLVAVDHHNAYEGAHHSGAQKSEDNGDADGPNTGREEVVKWVAWVHKGL